MADLFKPGSFKLEESASIDSNSLTIADDRATWFEAIRDPSDPLLRQKRSSKTELRPADYLISASADPINTPKTDFDAIKARIQQKLLQESKEAVKKEKEADFIKGLLGG